MRHDDFRAVVKRQLASRGQSAIVAARAAGLNRDSIRSVLRGRSPSVDRAAEICDALGLEFYTGPPRRAADHGTGGPVPGSRVQAPPATVADLQQVLKVAAQAGTELAARATEVARQLGSADLVAVAPIVGRVAAGIPAEAEQHDGGWAPFPAAWAGGGNCFALRVVGDSMTNAGILDGDTAIVRRQETARSGDIVAATVEGETTLKRYLVDGNVLLLAAEHAEYSPIDITATGAVVHGRVVGLLRAYR